MSDFPALTGSKGVDFLRMHLVADKRPTSPESDRLWVVSRVDPMFEFVHIQEIGGRGDSRREQRIDGHPPDGWTRGAVVWFDVLNEEIFQDSTWGDER